MMLFISNYFIGDSSTSPLCNSSFHTYQNPHHDILSFFHFVLSVVYYEPYIIFSIFCMILVRFKFIYSGVMYYCAESRILIEPFITLKCYFQSESHRLRLVLLFQKHEVFRFGTYIV